MTCCRCRHFPSWYVGCRHSEDVRKREDHSQSHADTTRQTFKEDRGETLRAISHSFLPIISGGFPRHILRLGVVSAVQHPIVIRTPHSQKERHFNTPQQLSIQSYRTRELHLRSAVNLQPPSDGISTRLCISIPTYLPKVHFRMSRL
jgi:hypothetical protein